MYYNQNFLYQSNGTQYSSQSNANFNENVPMPLHQIYMPTGFPAYTQVFDFERNETMLSDHFSNLFLYEQIWKPIGAHTTSKTESSVNNPSIHIQSPVAHSTPRPIRKLLKTPLEIQNVSKGDKKIDTIPEQNGLLRTKKTDIKMSKPKQMGKAIGAKSSLNSSSNSLDSFSPKSNSNQRKLPLRSQGIDMSQFLNKNSEYGSSCESSFLGTDSSFGKFKNKEKVTVQNKCLFCENNGESPEIYMSHPLKDSLGKVVCPVLRNYECPKCGESGDYAHTNKYCPETQRKQKENKIKKFFNQRD